MSRETAGRALLRDAIRHAVDVVASQRTKSTEARGASDLVEEHIPSSIPGEEQQPWIYSKAELPPFNLQTARHVAGPYDHKVWRPESVVLEVRIKEGGMLLERWHVGLERVADPGRQKQPTMGPPGPRARNLKQVYRKMCIALRALCSLCMMLPAAAIVETEELSFDLSYGLKLPSRDDAPSVLRKSLALEPLYCESCMLTFTVHYAHVEFSPSVGQQERSADEHRKTAPSGGLVDRPPGDTGAALDTPGRDIALEGHKWNFGEHPQFLTSDAVDPHSTTPAELGLPVTRAVSNPRDIPNSRRRHEAAAKDDIRNVKHERYPQSMPAEFQTLARKRNRMTPFKTVSRAESSVTSGSYRTSLGESQGGYSPYDSTDSPRRRSVRFTPQSLPAKLVQLPSGTMYKSYLNSSVASLGASITSSQSGLSKMAPRNPDIAATNIGDAKELPGGDGLVAERPNRLGTRASAAVRGSARRASMEGSALSPFKKDLRRRLSSRRQGFDTISREKVFSTASMPWFTPESEVDALAQTFVNNYRSLSRDLEQRDATEELPFAMLEEEAGSQGASSGDGAVPMESHDFEAMCRCILANPSKFYPSDAVKTCTSVKQIGVDYGFA